MRHLCTTALLVALAAIPVRSQQAAQMAKLAQIVNQPPAKMAYPPKAINHIEAEYPDKARKRHLSGFCAVSLVVDESGQPREIKLLHCSDPVFEKNTLEAVAKYLFEPGRTEEGKPVAARVSLSISFRLNGGKIAGTQPNREQAKAE